MSTKPNTKYASSKIPNWVFYVPFAYYYQVRLGTLAQLASWAMLYIFPTLFYSLCCAYSISSIVSAIVLYLAILIATFTLYELGYIANDTIGTRLESNPTERLYDYNKQFISKHWASVVCTRIVIVLCAMIISSIFIHATGLRYALYANMALILLIFTIYNTIPRPARVWVYPILLCSRFTPYLIPYYEIDGWCIILLLLLCSYPLCLSIERFSMPRKRYPIARKLIPQEQSKTLFRVGYYLAVGIALAVIAHCLHWNMILMIPYAVLLLYRLFLLTYTRYKKPTHYLNG